MNPVISVNGLGKRFWIPTEEKPAYKNLREDISGAFGRLLGKKNQDPQGTEFWALQNISFEVEAGDVLGIIGKNGAGKSTLLKILARITPPTRGTVEIRGRIGALLEVGTGFHPELTGRENIFMNGAILGMKKEEIKRKFDEIVAFSEVEKFIDTPVKHYSSGMYVRLAFAVAAHCDPDILIVDEVLAVGDASFQRKCLGKMGSVSKEEGRTVLFVTHNMTALQTLCKKSLWLEEGQVRESGETSGIVARYLSTSTSLSRERIWQDPESAPGNEKIKWRRCAIRVEETDGDSVLTVAKPVIVEFECWNFVENARLNFSLHIFSFEGVRILNTFSRAQHVSAGLFKGECHIPANFLNNQTYRMTILMVENEARVISSIEDALIFEVHDVKRNIPWFGPWEGVVRPQFDWVIHTSGS